YEDAVFAQSVAASKAGLVKRAPVVTVMGHVDHGKTTLLDTLRKTRVAEKEAGGITQKIGAYTIRLKDHTFVFIDTPGHEAFTNLRARGAQVTDIVVLVVAANDGVQPQTIEAINHAKAAGVPIIVAINKIDLAGADSNRVKQELSKHQVLVEEWGGDVVAVEISAKLNKNLDQLLEMIHLVAEMQELKAYPDVPARGTVIESRLDPQLGPIATVLIQHGHLSRGDAFMCGNTTGKIKSIFGDAGEVLQNGIVPQPVEIMGFEDVPEAGDRLQIVTDVERAKRVIDSRRQCLRDSRSHDQQQEKKISLQNLYQLMEGNKTQSFKVLLKADNFGSSEVLTALLQKKSSDRLKIEIIQSGIGNITEGDVLMASTAGAVIFAFNVKAPQKILALAKREQIEIKLYSVIYHLIEEVDQAIAGKIEPVFGETRIGMVEVLQIFKISKLGNVAGCLVREGKVTNKSLIKVMRGSDLVFEGIIQQLKRVKDEVAEVRAGTECGIRIKNFNDVEAGDTLEIYERTQIG
ncbi:MAG TPA: translation initiation factor IF-2, partial [Candidatus Aminicenantes bacterium]|nr:translation initiation factor IF-2 [Candidatus Aminicenantes bacterium]